MQYPDISRYVSKARKAEVVIGIDPDCDKSGFAVLDKTAGTLTLGRYDFVGLIEELGRRMEMYSGHRDWVIVVEAGYLTGTANDHYFGDNIRVAAKVAQKVGRNHETARKIVEVCRMLKFPVEERKPLRKIWGKSHNEKISSEEFNALTGYTKRTSQDVRDAALLAWVSAGYSTNIKKK